MDWLHKFPWKKLRSRLALLGWLIVLIRPLWKGVELAGDLEFLMRNAKPILSFLNTGLGTLVLMGTGFALIIIAVLREGVSLEPAESIPHMYTEEEVATKIAEAKQEKFEEIARKLKDQKPKGITPKGREYPLAETDHIREQLGILYRSVADPSYNKAHELLGKMAQRLKEAEDDNARQEVSVLLNRTVMEADRAARTQLGTALESDAMPVADSKYLQELFGDYFEKYQQLAEWIDRAGRLIGSPEFMGDPDYLRWRDQDREFLGRLWDTIAQSEFSWLRQHVHRVGRGDEFRPTL